MSRRRSSVDLASRPGAAHPRDRGAAASNQAAIPAARGGSVEPEVDAVLAGFNRWLADGALPPGQRRRCHLAVERFRSWHTEQRHHTGLGHDLHRHDIDYGRRRYLMALGAAGHSHIELTVVDTALELLCRYLEHMRDPDTSHHDRTPSDDLPGDATALAVTTPATADRPSAEVVRNPVPLPTDLTPASPQARQRRPALERAVRDQPPPGAPPQ